MVTSFRSLGKRQIAKNVGIKRKERRAWDGKVNWRRIADRLYGCVQIWQLELFFQPTVASPAEPLSRLLHQPFSWRRGMKEKTMGDREMSENTRENAAGMDRNDERTPKGDTESPYDDCRRLSGPFPRFSSSFPPYHLSYRPFTVRVSSNDMSTYHWLATKNHR